MTERFDFSGLNQVLVSSAESFLPDWLPGGNLRGQEYRCADIHGGPGSSMSVNVNTGMWADFASGQKGGDLVSLYAAIRGVSQSEAYKSLNNMYGSSPVPVKPKQTPSTFKPGRPPQTNQEPPFKKGFSGKYIYKDAQGYPVFYIIRYNLPNDKKEFKPWCWCSTQNKWVMKQWPSPRPLYNLDKLMAHPKRGVLIVEGEKAALAAEKFVDPRAYVVTTWPGGSSACKHVDWSPLSNRRILIWPDADEPGIKASTQIANILKPNVREIKIIDTSSFNSGMDAADFNFIDMASFTVWAKPKVSIFGAAKIPDILPDPEPSLAEPPPQPVALADPEGMPQEMTPSKLALWQDMGLSVSKTTGPHPTHTNVAKALEGHSKLKDKVWFDEFHGKFLTIINWTGPDYKCPREWQEYDDLALSATFHKDLGMHRITDIIAHKGMVFYAKQRVRNEPKAWFSSLKWDGTPRVESFFASYLGCKPSQYVSAVGKNFWLSMVARIYQPGCKADNMVILEGPQGHYKSTALSIIGGKWYVETNENPNSKDFYQIFQGKILIEIGELDSFNKAETTKIKAVVSTAVDRFRPPYERSPRDFPRQCIFVGTTNESNYLRDPTGGRRFWPISIGKINTVTLRADREQLFAEACHLYKMGESWHVVPKEAAEEQELRRDVDAWEDIIYNYLATSTDEYITVSSICVAGLGMDVERITPLVSKRVARILRTLGWTRGKKRVPCSTRSMSVFFPPDSSSAQINSKSSDSVQQRPLINHAPGQH